MKFETAVALSRNNESPEQLEAMEWLITHRDELKTKVFIVIPGGKHGNNDKQWKFVKDNSESRCSCGNERVINPINERKSFLGSGRFKTITPGVKIYVRAIGSDKEACCMWIELIEDSGDIYLRMVQEPFAPLVFSVDMIFPRGYKLSDFKSGIVVKNRELPIWRVHDVSVEKKELTMEFDAATEEFNPTIEPDRHAAVAP